jgi:hypothetical protein
MLFQGLRESHQRSVVLRENVKEGMHCEPRANSCLLRGRNVFPGLELTILLGGPGIKKSVLESPFTIMDRERIWLSILSARY